MRPVLWWAALGLVAVGFQLYVYIGWIASSDFRSVPTGSDPVPHHLKVVAWILQTAFGLAAAGCTAWIVRGCLRARRLTFDAKLSLGWISVIWIDPAANWIRPQMMFNSYYINRGSWVQHIPGWIGRNGRLLPDPFFIEFATYFFMIAITIAGCAFMRELRRRRPRVGMPGLVLSTWLLMVGFVFVIEELVVIRGGWVWWSGSIHALTPWAGTSHAIPLTEMALWGGTITAFVALRFRHENGELRAAESGIDRLRTSARRTGAISTFAVIGYATVAMGGYAVASAGLALYAGPSPQHIPSYFRNGQCGEGTAYACPGPNLPILLPHSPDH
jgi:Spirocyclase AveC-like